MPPLPVRPSDGLGGKQQHLQQRKRVVWHYLRDSAPNLLRPRPRPILAIKPLNLTAASHRVSPAPQEIVALINALPASAGLGQQAAAGSGDGPHAGQCAHRVGGVPLLLAAPVRPAPRLGSFCSGLLGWR